MSDKPKNTVVVVSIFLVMVMLAVTVALPSVVKKSSEAKGYLYVEYDGDADANPHKSTKP